MLWCQIGLISQSDIMEELLLWSFLGLHFTGSAFIFLIEVVLSKAAESENFNEISIMNGHGSKRSNVRFECPGDSKLTVLYQSDRSLNETPNVGFQLAGVFSKFTSSIFETFWISKGQSLTVKPLHSSLWPITSRDSRPLVLMEMAGLKAVHFQL